MYDTLMIAVILERLGELLRDLMNHPTKALLVLGGLVLIAWWATRKK